MTPFDSFVLHTCTLSLPSFQKFEIRGSHIDLSSLAKGETLGVVCVPPYDVRFTINGQEIRFHPNIPPHESSSGPKFLFVDIYGPVCSVESLPVEMREGVVVLRMGGPPREVGRAGGTECRYFNLCRRFLWAQRGTIAGDDYKYGVSNTIHSTMVWMSIPFPF